MALTSLTVEGYKPFAAPASVKIRPLNVVFGTNSAGKSSLLRLFPLLAESIRLKPSEPFAAMGAAMKNASVVDLFCKFSKAPVMSINLDFDGASGVTSARYRLRKFNKGHSTLAAIESLILEGAAGNLEIALDLNSIESFDSGKLRYELTEAGKMQLVAFAGLLPTAFSPDNAAQMPSAQRALSIELEAFNEVTWLGPFRSTPPRIELESGIPNRMGSLGGEASAWLASRSDGMTNVKSTVSTWFENNFGQSLDVGRSAGKIGGNYSLVFYPTKDPERFVPVMDTGEGMGQVLPVLTAAALAGYGHLGQNPYLLVEHPDLHLHANVHKALLDYFIDCTKLPTKPKIAIETHSEAMLTALQIAIIEKRIAHSDVIVHWVESEENGASFVKSLEFDAQAFPVGGSWPGADWFNALHAQMSKLARLRIAS